MKKQLTPEQIAQLFDTFAYPILKPAITEHQKRVATCFAKTLWLLLVKSNDTESMVYQTLSSILGNKHEQNIVVGSLYFHQMKTTLSPKQIAMLIDYYSDSEKFKALENWLDKAHFFA